MKTKTETQHTPTPWIIDPRQVGTRWNIGTDKEDVCLVQEVSNDRNYLVRNANTDCIVRAVNSYEGNLAEIVKLRHSHEVLLAAAKEALEYMDDDGYKPINTRLKEAIKQAKGL